MIFLISFEDDKLREKFFIGIYIIFDEKELLLSVIIAHLKVAAPFSRKNENQGI